MKHSYPCPYLSDRAKLREFKNDKLLPDYSVYRYYMMITFESSLAMNNNNNKNNTAIYL